MSTIAAVLLCAGLFVLAAFLREPRRCGSHCAGCLGACDRDSSPAKRTDGRRIQRGSLTLESTDD